MSEGEAEGVAWQGYGQDQMSIEQWVRSRIGDNLMDNLPERALRIAEEALELSQAEHYAVFQDRKSWAAQMHKLVDAVASKPAGQPEQEMGGVITCVLAWCAARELRLDAIAAAELKRIFKISPEHFKRRTAEKFALGVGGDPDA